VQFCQNEKPPTVKAEERLYVVAENLKLREIAIWLRFALAILN
jgi:hypothetical protein